jgi:hypothetical protein
MVPKISKVSASHDTTRDAAATTPVDDNVSIVTSDLHAQSRRQLRKWLLIANVIAWIVIILAIKIVFF